MNDFDTYPLLWMLAAAIASLTLTGIMFPLVAALTPAGKKADDE